MRILKLAGLTLLYGLLFHLMARACVFLFGPIAAEASMRRLLYVLFPALVAAMISVLVWRWRFGAMKPADTFLVGAIAATLVLANTVKAHGIDGLLLSPLHISLMLAIIFFAVPICGYATRRG